MRITVHADADSVAQAAADRMAAAILRDLAHHPVTHVCLTGGRGGGTTLGALARDRGIEWHRVHCWWSDERFLPEGDEARNDTLARHVLLERVDIPAANMHPMPARDGDGPGAGARRYAAELGDFGGTSPRFCVSILGMGEDGHVASLFPEHAAVTSHEPVVAVLDSPKPPPVRITMTLPTINSADEVLIIATGPQKADAVGMLVNAPGPRQLPAAGVHGIVATHLFLDEAAAAHVPSALRERS
jgi:6-phosphogluconolactonase